MNDFEDICRVCTISEVPLINLFELRGLKNASEMLSDCLQVPVSNKDNLPQKICLPCHAQLEVAYHFLNKARRNMKELTKKLIIQREAINQVQIKDDENSTVLKIEYLDENSQSFEQQLEDSSIETAENTITHIYHLCNICEKTFLTVKALNFHQRIWHKNIQFI